MSRLEQYVRHSTKFFEANGTANCVKGFDDILYLIISNHVLLLDKGSFASEDIFRYLLEDYAELFVAPDKGVIVHYQVLTNALSFNLSVDLVLKGLVFGLL